MSVNMKLVSKGDILEESQKVKENILGRIGTIISYLEKQYDDHVSALLSMYFNAAPFNQETISEKSIQVLKVLDFFGEKETLVHRAIKSLELGYVHHVEHITTAEMAEQLGISTQAIYNHLYDVNDPVEVDKVKNNPKKKFIPVRKYPKLVLAEKQEFDQFKEWFLLKKRKGVEGDETFN